MATLQRSDADLQPSTERSEAVSAVHAILLFMEYCDGRTVKSKARETNDSGSIPVKGRLILTFN